MKKQTKTNKKKKCKFCGSYKMKKGLVDSGYYWYCNKCGAEKEQTK